MGPRMSLLRGIVVQSTDLSTGLGNVAETSSQEELH